MFRTVTGTAIAAGVAAFALSIIGVVVAAQGAPDPDVTALEVAEAFCRHHGEDQLCLDPTTTTQPPSSTTAAPTTTSTTVPATTSTTTSTTTAAPPTTTTTTTTLPPSPGGFTEDFTSPESMDRFGSIAWHRGNLGGADASGDHAPMAGSDPDACTDPFTTRVIPKYAETLFSYDPLHVYRCAPDDDPAKGHVMTVVGEQSGYDFTAMWTAEPLSGVTEVRWDQNITDNGDRNWSEVAVVPAENWNPLQPPCSITDIPCFTTAPGGAGNGGQVSHADAGSVGMSWFNVQPMLTSPIDQDKENWLFRDDWAGSIYNVMEARHQAFSSPAPRFTHVLRDNGDGTISFLLDTQTAEYGVQELVTINGSFPQGDVVVAFKAHDYRGSKDETRLYTSHTWHWDNIEVS